MRSGIVQRWIDLSVAATRDETAAIPLIDGLELNLDLNLDLDEELHQVWRAGDSELHDDFVAALLESPTNLAVRFAALHIYYLLMEHKRDLEEEDLGGFARERKAFRKKLAMFVGFRSVESCTDLRTIRWEIVNSCAAEDYSRAFRLCDQLQPLLPDWHVSLVRGRLRFLAVQLPLWDDRLSLSSWDLPIGPPTVDIVRLVGMQSPLLRCLSLPELTTEIPDGDRAHLHRAIAELKIASDGNPDFTPECRLMLARSYAAVGQYHESARCYREVLTHRGTLIGYFKEPFPFPPEVVSRLLSALFERLVTAHRRAEEIDEAIEAAQEWIGEFPDAPNAYLLMARLHDEKGDHKAAAGWLRRGEERIPELGEDWKTSLIFKFDEISPVASIDQTINTYSAHHPDAIRLVRFALKSHWSAFGCLDEESKQRWSTGIHLLSTKSYGEPSSGFAVHAFSGVIERTLREFIFVPFREAYRLNPELVGDISGAADDAKVFCEFLGGKRDPAFGQMLTITKKSVKSPQSPFGPFAEWLRKTHPSYFGGIQHLDQYMMPSLRNREDHFTKNMIAEVDAEKMLKAGVELVSAILEDPASRANPV